MALKDTNIPVRGGGTTVVLALAALTAGCGATFRTIGMQDASVEIVRAMAATQTASVKALTDALQRAQSSACSSGLVLTPVSEVR